MSAKKNNLIYVFYTLLIATIMLSVCAVVVTANQYEAIESYSLDTEEVSIVNDGWMTISDNLADFVDFGIPLDTKEITLSRIFIFDKNYVDNELSFMAYNSAVKVYQDGVLIYSFGDASAMRKGVLIGNYYCNVPLVVYPGEASEITIEFVSSSPVTVGSFMIGKTNAISATRFKASVSTIIFGVSVFGTIFIMLVIAFFCAKSFKLGESFYLLLCFIGTVAVWAISYNPVLGKMIARPEIITLINYESFMIMGIPFFMYLFYSFNKMKAVDIVGVLVLTVNFVVMNVMHFTGTANFANTVLATKLINLACVIMIAIQSVIELAFDRSKVTIPVVIGTFIIIIAVALQFLDMFNQHEQDGNIPYFELGLLLFTMIQVITLVDRIFVLVKEGQKVDSYIQIAKTDPLTGLGNRRALDTYISEIAATEAPTVRVGCIVCDLNDLKKTNDIYGHVVGDNLIKDFANCLKICFENRGVAFRTGGDEFFVMFSDVEVDMSAMMRRLTICIEGTNSTAEYKLSCSSGCHADYVPTNSEAAIWDVIKMADAEMYKQKKVDRQKRMGGDIIKSSILN